MTEDNSKIIIPNFSDTYSKSIKFNILNNRENDYNFEIINNSGDDISYRLDINSLNDKEFESHINYQYKLNNYQSNVLKLSDNYNIINNHKLNDGMSDVYQLNFKLLNAYSNDSSKMIISILVTKKGYQEYLGDIIGNKSESNELEILNNDSNNYVWFNCNDGHITEEKECERWRIIGRFKQEINNNIIDSVKIMRSEPLHEVSFNNDDLDGNFEYSYINNYLNGYYYDSLSSSAQKLIVKGKWNIGEVKSSDYLTIKNEEKNNFVYTDIGLLNPSEYISLKDKWMNLNERIMTLNKNGNSVIVIDNNGISLADSYTDMAYIPCLYLKNNISMVSGNGTYDNPYELQIIK